MKPAVFLDRDGTIIKDRGYLGHIHQVEFYPFTFECLRQLQEKYLLFIVTNQSGIAKGVVTHQHVDSVNSNIVSELLSRWLIVWSISTVRVASW